MSDLIPYPWQQSSWQSLLAQIESNKLPHALLLTGQKGIGKWHYAELIASYLLCLHPISHLPCGKCRACELLAAGNHPDKYLVRPEEANKSIKVDQIRELSTFVAKTAQQQGYKVAIIGPVEQLNVNAGNALLKSLEEPAGRTILILISHVSSGVMATIRSRCQLMTMPVPSRNDSIEWLNQTNAANDSQAMLDISAGSPLQAGELAEGDKREALLVFLADLITIQKNAGHVDLSLSKGWMALELMDLLDWWVQCINLLVHTGNGVRYVDDYSKAGDIAQHLTEILAISPQLKQQWLHKLLDRILTIKRQLLAGANPNKQLLLEELLLDWSAVIKAANKNHRQATA